MAQAPAADRMVSRSRGFTLIELVLVIALIGSFAGVLFERVDYYTERAELAAMESTAAAYRTGLQFRVAAYLLNRRPEDVNLLNDENPVGWLADKPANYAGEFYGEAAAEVAAGSWYFDSKTRTMVYTVRRSRYFEAGREGLKIRFRARAEYGPMLDGTGKPIGSSGVRVLQFAPTEPYKWFG